MSALSYLYIFTRSKKASNHTNSYQFTKSRKQIEMQFTDIKMKSIPPGQKNAHNNQTTLQPPTMSSISTSVFSVDAFEDNNNLNSIIQQVK